MRVLFHGRLAEAIGPAIELDVTPGSTVAELRERLIALHPEAMPSLSGERVLACVGDTLVDDAHTLRAGDIVELLPPVSGG